MRSYAHKKGLAGEDRAVCYLQKKGYRILSRNYRFHRYEIDIIARHGDTVVFIEVKARRSEDFGVPELALRRDPGQRLVIAPYASLLALPIR